MVRWQWIGGAAAMLLLVAAGAVAYKFQGMQASMGEKTSNAFTNVRELPSPLVGESAPPVELDSLTTGSLKLGDYQGKLVLLSFWSHF